MANITYHDHPAGGTLTGTDEEIPGWSISSGAARKWPSGYFKRLRINPSSVSAAGSDQTGATALSNSFDYHLVSTVGAGAGTKFTAATSGQVGEVKTVRVSASAANSLTIYPPSGGTLNEQASNLPMLIEAGVTAQFLFITTVDLVSIP
jgi:hypothetical protein